MKPTVEVKFEFPEAEHRVLKAKSALAGKSIADYVREMVRKDLAEGLKAPAAKR